jgi:hypothetical protein
LLKVLGQVDRGADVESRLHGNSAFEPRRTILERGWGRTDVNVTWDARRVFGFDKVRSRGLKNNHHRLCACFALVNLYLRKQTTGPALGVGSGKSA